MGLEGEELRQKQHLRSYLELECKVFYTCASVIAGVLCCRYYPYLKSEEIRVG